jgi:hypothetical protein
MRIKTKIKAGKLAANHSRNALKVRSGLKSGGESLNHSRALL